MIYIVLLLVCWGSIVGLLCRVLAVVGAQQRNNNDGASIPSSANSIEQGGTVTDKVDDLEDVEQGKTTATAAAASTSAGTVETEFELTDVGGKLPEPESKVEGEKKKEVTIFEPTPAPTSSSSVLRYKYKSPYSK